MVSLSTKIDDLGTEFNDSYSEATPRDQHKP